MADKITITREELYELVWSKPVVKIGKDFGISDVAVANCCKKMNIPKPGLRHGQKVKKLAVILQSQNIRFLGVHNFTSATQMELYRLAPRIQNK